MEKKMNKTNGPRVTRNRDVQETPVRSARIC